MTPLFEVDDVDAGIEGPPNIGVVGTVIAEDAQGATGNGHRRNDKV